MGEGEREREGTLLKRQQEFRLWDPIGEVHTYAMVDARMVVGVLSNPNEGPTLLLHAGHSIGGLAHSYGEVAAWWLKWHTAGEADA